MADSKSPPTSGAGHKCPIPTSPPPKSPNPHLSLSQSPSHFHTTPDSPDPLTFYNHHSYAGTPLPPENPLETGIWANATRTPKHYISSNGTIFHDPPPALYRFQAPADIPEANMIQEALSYTWKDFDGWVGWKVPRWEENRMKSYNEQWEFIQYALVLWWKGPKNLTPRLVSVGPWKRGLWDFVEPRWEVEALWWGYDGMSWEEYEQCRMLMRGDCDSNENGCREQDEQEGRRNGNGDRDREQEERKERRVVKPTANAADLDRAWNEIHCSRPFWDDELETLAMGEGMDGEGVDDGYSTSVEFS